MTRSGNRKCHYRTKRGRYSALISQLFSGLLLTSVFGLLVGCSDEFRSANTYPVKLEKVAVHNGLPIPVDLTGNGTAEWIEMNEKRLLAYHSNFGLIDQVNFDGRINNYVNALDTDADGDNEVLVSYRRSDSLFEAEIHFEGSEATVPISYFITSGRSRVTQTGVHEWRGSVSQVFLVNQKPDGSGQLLSLVETGLSPVGRGIYLHDIGRTEPVGALVIGGNVSRYPRANHSGILRDFDNDGFDELVIATGGSNNGGDASGINDRFAFIMRIDLNPTLEIGWSKQLGEEWFDVILTEGAFSDSRKAQVLLATLAHRNARGYLSSLRFVDVVQGTLLTPVYFDVAIRDVETVDLDGVGSDEILVLLEDGTLHVLNEDLDIIKTSQFENARMIQIHSDVDDGIDEIELFFAGVTALLSPDLRVKAVIRGRIAGGLWRIQGSEILFGFTTLGELNIASGIQIVRWTNQPYWWLILLGQYMSPLVGFILLFTGTVTIRRKYKRWRTGIDENLAVVQQSILDLFIRSGDPRKKALIKLEERFMDPEFDVDAWASEIGYGSPRQLQRVIKDYLGETPEFLLWQRRVDEGKTMLERDIGKTIAEIAFLVGFKEQSHFTRKFREIVGVTPSEFRDGKGTSRH